MDFTVKTYRSLLNSLLDAGYSFLSFDEDLASLLPNKLVVLRHDVDLLPFNSLRTARLEHELGIKGVYYFRAVPESWNESVIKEVAELGHEVGYHYESLTTCKGDERAAYDDFRINLERLREIVPVKTICMHGSPRSPHDSKNIWKEYSYKDLGIIGEPYLDTDFSKIFYLTDTGRRWDGYKASVRDKIENFQEEWNKKGLTFHTTKELITAISAGKMPDKIMITIHPQRWNNFGAKWIKELVLQNLKNIIKKLIVNKNL
jgi:hypothetical protein